MTPGRVSIAGGSVGGLFAAALLQRDGWRVTVHERSKRGLDGKGAGLVPQSEVSEVLQEIGRADVLDSLVIAKERIFLDRTGDVLGAAHTPQGQMSWDLLYRAFRQEIEALRYHAGALVQRVEDSEDTATLHFANDPPVEADLIIGADGIGSNVREFVAPETKPVYAGYAAFRGLASELKLPQRSAALLSGRFVFYDAPGMQFLGYLVAGADGSIEPGQRRYNWVWYRSLTQQRFQDALASEAGDQLTYSAPPGGLSSVTLHELRESARRDLPDVLSDVLVAEAAPFVQGIFDYETPRMVRSRVALLGDAAFVVRPHTAMGVSKAAGDAMALRDALRSHETVPEALLAYEQIRLPIGRKIAQYGRRLGSGFPRY
ncbi:2-polyprenyl-6-methoxyphenol hydroxylase [Bryocella elongata]|uniref:2-polyprenyl-6-methoxyphenol hydroxylase n=1 Tax=Bryocella elongata TaxID=863522 RepID=A0A1H5T433_9BACT|nr:FAD-dependent monooxygenase [Bryocella elongata]SEF57546.1 2-polyprenyl-6-methoxyphenol hydroxylase [Bryocella elongata]